MSENIGAHVERLIALGVPPGEAATIVAELFVAGVQASSYRSDVQPRSAGAIRQERYRRNKASQSVTGASQASQSVTSDECDVTVFSSERPSTPLSSTVEYNQNTSKKAPKGAQKGSDLGESFERFWRAYPRRDGSNPKQPAAVKFQGHVRRGIDPEAIIAGAMAYAASVAGEDPRFTAQAVTWLNQRRWEDQHHRSPPHVRLDPVQAALQDRIDRIEACEGHHPGPRPGRGDGRDLHLDLADDGIEIGL